MQGFYNVTERIRVQLAQDEFVNTITYGDIFRVDLKKQTIFPLSHVVVNNATMEGNIFRYNISVMAMDIVDISKDAIENTAIGQFRGNDNEQDVLNTQFAVIARLLKVLEGGDLFTALYQLDGNPNIEPFTERFENYLAGWVATFDVLIPNDMTACDAATIPSIICADATQVTTDSDGNELYSNTIPSGTTETQVIQDSTAVLKDTLGTTISTTPILAEGSEDIIAPNSTYLVEYVNGTDIQSGSIVSGGSVVVTVPNPVTCEDATVEVNGVLFDTVASGDTLDIEVRQEQGSTQVGSKQGQYWRVDDSPVNINGGLIANVPAEDTLSINVTLNGTNSGTWNSGTQTWEIVSAAASVGATLMKTGQTTSYRTGDDGDIEAGRAVDFLTLASNNPFGNTNRFTDELGGSTYTNNIVIDWSTYDGVTVLGYTRNLSTGALKNWADCIDQAAATSIGTYTSGWRLSNRKEIENIMRFEGTTLTVFNYAPFNQGVATNIWTSTTYAFNTANAHCLASSGNGNFTIAVAKTIALAQYYAVRTFTVTGTTLT